METVPQNDAASQPENAHFTSETSPIEGLSPAHYAMLSQESGIADDVIRERGYRTSTGRSELKSLGIVIRRDTHATGLIIPLRSADGTPLTHFHAQENRRVPLVVYRPDVPETGKDSRYKKYIFPNAALMRLDCPPRCQPDMDDPSKPLWITEGSKKGDAIASHGGCAVVLQGVWCWSGQNEKGGKTALTDWRDVALNGRDVRIVFDSDVVEKESVQKALTALISYLESKDAQVSIASLPSANGEKVGVDDFLLTHTLQDLEALLQAPQTRAHNATAPYGIPFKMTAHGTPRAILFNVMAVLEQDARWHGVLKYNEFSGVIELHEPPPPFALYQAWKTQPLEDYHASEISRWLQAEYDLCAPTTLVREALITVARHNTYHPIQDYLNGLIWDGVSRLDTWLTTHCRVEDSAYVRAIAAKTLIAAVARIMRPGCKMDTVTILEGLQGLLKSTVWRILASDDWFTDTLPDLHSKDAALTLRGKWIIELAELDTLSRNELETIKRFLSSTQDHYRPPYERHAQTVPRANIFVGTTNKEAYLKDETGNRRFWPVRAQGRCDLVALERDRDQLWAEAMARFQDGEIWYLTGDLLQQSEAEQATRVEADPWTETILNYLDMTPLTLVYYKGKDLQSITTRELLEQALGLDKLHWTSGNSRRVANILRLHKWHYDRVENPEKDSGARQVKVFIRETDEPDTMEDSEASASVSPPHKTYSETDETDETDTLCVYRTPDDVREYRSYNNACDEVRIGSFENPSVSTVSSVSDPSTTTTSTPCTETDVDTPSVSDSPRADISPRDPCPHCGQMRMKAFKAGILVCHKCGRQSPTAWRE